MIPISVDKSTMAFRVVPALVSFVYLLFAFRWYEMLSVGLLLGHKIDTVMLMASGTSVVRLFFSTLFLATPFMFAPVVWKCWSEQKASLVGWLGTVLTAVSAGFSTVIMVATSARRGLFSFFGSEEGFLDFPYGVEHISAFSVSSEQAVLWVVASVVWAAAMLTGYLTRRGYVVIG